MVIARCWVCEREREIDATDLVTPLCDETCAGEFMDVVEHLASGSSAKELGLDPASRLFQEAVREIEARRRQERIFIRDTREAEWERNRPRRMRPLYPV